MLRDKHGREIDSLAADPNDTSGLGYCGVILRDSRDRVLGRYATVEDAEHAVWLADVNQEGACDGEEAKGQRPKDFCRLCGRQ